MIASLTRLFAGQVQHDYEVHQNHIKRFITGGEKIQEDKIVGVFEIAQIVLSDRTIWACQQKKKSFLERLVKRMEKRFSKNRVSYAWHKDIYNDTKIFLEKL